MSLRRLRECRPEPPHPGHDLVWIKLYVRVRPKIVRQYRAPLVRVVTADQHQLPRFGGSEFVVRQSLPHRSHRAITIGRIQRSYSVRVIHGKYMLPLGSVKFDVSLTASESHVGRDQNSCELLYSSGVAARSTPWRGFPRDRFLYACRCHRHPGVCHVVESTW